MININELNEQIKQEVHNIKDIRTFITKHKQYVEYFKTTVYESLRNYIKCILLNININVSNKCVVCGNKLTIKQILHRNKILYI